MREEEHHVQDSLELYAVAYLQRLAQERGVAISGDWQEKYRDFVDYASARGLKVEDFDTGDWPEYKAAYDLHLPQFFDRLVEKFPGESFDFINVEVANRNAQRKGDFQIVMSGGSELSVSLKNYRGGALRPQVQSGTYNSFILNFLFDSPRVGTFYDPDAGVTFRSSPAAVRDAALESLGYDSIIPLMRRMDDVNISIRARFIDGPEFEHLDEAVFGKARKETGFEGAAVAVEILSSVEPARLKARALKMTGMDGAEELLLLDPVRCADTVTNERFRILRDSLHDPTTTVRPVIRGQGLGFDFVNGDRVLLQVDVPFSINKNGAWISGVRYDGVRLHVKEKAELAYGQRRPRKSRELATSINTYVNFGATGIFGTPTASSTGERELGEAEPE